jgi:hypothetical protein
MTDPAEARGAVGRWARDAGNCAAQSDRPDIGYAMIFPGTTIVKILFVDIVLALF